MDVLVGRRGESLPRSIRFRHPTPQKASRSSASGSGPTIAFRAPVSSRHQSSLPHGQPHSIHRAATTLAPSAREGRAGARRAAEASSRYDLLQALHDPGSSIRRRARCERRRAAVKVVDNATRRKPSGRCGIRVLAEDSREHRAEWFKGLFQRFRTVSRRDSGAPRTGPPLEAAAAGDDQGQLRACGGHRLPGEFRGTSTCLKRLHNKKTRRSLSTLALGPARSASSLWHRAHYERTQTRIVFTRRVSSGARAYLGVVWNANSGLSLCRRPLNLVMLTSIVMTRRDARQRTSEAVTIVDESYRTVRRGRSPA